MASILVLTGSRSQRSATSALALHVGDELALEGHSVDVIHLRGLPAPALRSGDTAHPAVAAAVRAVFAADALVVATPVDEASPSGLLELFLDLLPQAALHGKVVLPLATGGTVAELAALDHRLRPRLEDSGARHVTSGALALDRHVDPWTGGPVLVDPATRAGVDRSTAELRSVLGGSRAQTPLLAGRR